MRYTDHSRFAYALDAIELVLDFFRIHVQPAGNDQILLATDEAHDTVLVDRRNVTGHEPTVDCEGLGGFVRVAPVAGEHVGPFDLEYSRLVRTEDPVCATYTSVHARQRSTDGSGNTFTVERVRRDHAGFRHAVTLENPLSRALLELVEHLGAQRRRARDPQAESGTLEREVGLGEQSRVVRRHAHEHRRGTERAFDDRCIET